MKREHRDRLEKYAAKRGWIIKRVRGGTRATKGHYKRFAYGAPEEAAKRLLQRLKDIPTEKRHVIQAYAILSKYVKALKEEGFRLIIFADRIRE